MTREIVESRCQDAAAPLEERGCNNSASILEEQWLWWRRDLAREGAAGTTALHGPCKADLRVRVLRRWHSITCHGKHVRCETKLLEEGG